MGKHKKSDIQLKKEKEAIQIEAYQKTLTKVKTKLSEAEIPGSKQKGVDFLRRYLEVPLGSRYARRSYKSFRGRSYNITKQAMALVDHMFVLFPVPLFLYRAVLSREGHSLVFDYDYSEPEAWKENRNQRYVRWFVVAAQGGSLAREMKGILNKKEVHWFLKAPVANTIQRNVFWARCAAAGVSLPVCQFLTERMGDANELAAMGNRRDDIIRFYAVECDRMGPNELREITDFVRAMIRRNDFSFKGRTLSSMVNLSNEWHAERYADREVKLQTWNQSFAPWTHKRKDSTIHAIELTSNRALADEGKRQNHCVYSYTHACARGVSKIVSVRWVGESGSLLETADILNRLTLEIWTQTREIIQIKGKHNRSADPHEMKIIRLWAADHGLKIQTYD